jgi:hypothetical protein
MAPLRIFSSPGFHPLSIYIAKSPPICAIFSQNDQELPGPAGDTKEILLVILSQAHLRDYFDSGHKSATFSMDEPDERMTLVVFNAQWF